MTFRKRHRGYDTAEVDKYIEETAAKEKQIRTAQKERIDELSDENYNLRQQLKKYQDNEAAISEALIASQNLAREMTFDAQKYSDLVLTRAKIFYATWRAYAQTLISSLSADEVVEFNKLQRKIEQIINAYEGSDVAREVDEGKYNVNGQQQNVAATNSAQQQPVQQPVQQSAQSTNNPISRIEQAAEQAIDLRELVRPEMSLEELCAELGLTVQKDK